MQLNTKAFCIVKEIKGSNTYIIFHTYCLVTDGIDVWDRFVNNQDSEYKRYKEDKLRYRLLHTDYYDSAGIDMKKRGSKVG